ncbi:uncharacterized protein LOC127777567 [Oryza glaberrima]|uniref:Uncharacterized protein n=2 Tax=Oryza TaxID=4527 RepID=A0A0D3GCM9_9ORYZ|nr:uncharacterized protein LOC127777567 [Oryza glaberrima]QCP66272.1 S1 hybrid sterility protein [Oryza glaberrima]QCP66273.1 S1 hybrid sterility protein [Oryza glaberrima]
MASNIQSEAESARDRAQESVVIVRVNTDPNEYCCGCVVRSKFVGGSGNRTTLVITSSKFVQGRENDLTVVFWNKKELKATFLRTHGAFCLLATDFYLWCQPIHLLEGNAGLENSRTFMRVPLNHSTTRFVFTYTSSRSVESYPVETPNHAVPNSHEYFMVSCSYFQKTSKGVSRLTGAPVFCTGDAGTAGRTIGIILQDCRPATGCSGAEFKVALNASHLQKVLSILDPPDPPQKRNHNLSGGKKRKATGSGGGRGRRQRV